MAFNQATLPMYLEGINPFFDKSGVDLVEGRR
jgi:hypothetical protein